MLIVISHAEIIAHEADLINQLFDEGLTLFHLRKPNSSEEDLKELICKIDVKHHSKLVLHQHHHLATVFNISRLHLTETVRKNRTETDIASLKTDLTHLSTSIHALKDYENLSLNFDYVFLGPVFDSISKKEYKAIELKDDLKKLKKRSSKLIALGGITKHNAVEPIAWGFDGIAVLGSIWEAKDPIDEFKQLNKACNHCEITL